MPLSIRYLNDPNQECVVRPTPLASISSDSNRNAEGQFGKTYKITLRGYLIVDQGFPLARRASDDDLFDYHANAGGYEAATANAGPYLTFDTSQSHFFQTGVADNRPKQQYVPYENALDAMFFKQKVLRELFGRDGQRLEISPINMDEAVVICYPRFVNISFTDGIYTDICEYTVELEADTIIDNQEGKVDIDGNPISSQYLTEDQILEASGRFIQSYSDGWSLEPDESLGESAELTKSYRITRNISATGKDHYGPGDKRAAWEQARDFVQFRLGDEPDYPNVMGQIGSGLLNLVDAYQGYSHSRTENISMDGGTYSVTENWLLASGTSYENYNMSVSTDIENSFVTVSINGEIKGLSSFSASGTISGGAGEDGIRPYDYALNKYYEVSNSGSFGVGCDIFKRANSVVAPALNAQPKSLSLSMNEYDGSITYSLNFDNRPTNILSGVLTESISINDTYPGDVFANIQIPGRSTGPILQAIGGRTDYQRSLSIDCVLDYTDIPYGSTRDSILLQKPSLVDPIKSQLFNLIKEVSPGKEPGVVKWFLSPPQESWEPKQGRYSLNMSWNYELDK